MPEAAICGFPVQALTRGPRHHLFGYHDVCPWDESGRLLLALEVDFIDRMPSGSEKARVGVVDTQDRSVFRPLGETVAWNFQQASRMQWIPGRPDHFAYNVREGDGFAAVVMDARSGEASTLPAPVYALSPDGRYSLSPSYERLARLGGYGYAGVPDPHADDPAPEADGIHRLDLATGARELVLSLAEVARFRLTPAPDRGHHFVTHVCFDPSGRRIAFLHRFALRDGGFFTRLLTANPDGRELCCLAEGTLSHFDWFDPQRVMIWGRNRPLLARARRANVFALPVFKPLLAFLRTQTRGFVRQRVIGDRYLLLGDPSGEASAIGVGKLTEDGHPSRLPGSRWLLTDTYPDEDHYRTLILYDLEEQRRIDVGRFYALPDAEHWVEALGESWEVSGMRADLHPRWSRDERRICFDSVHEGTRQIYAVDVAELTRPG